MQIKRFLFSFSRNPRIQLIRISTGKFTRICVPDSTKFTRSYQGITNRTSSVVEFG